MLEDSGRVDLISVARRVTVAISAAFRVLPAVLVNGRIDFSAARCVVGAAAAQPSHTMSLER